LFTIWQIIFAVYCEDTTPVYPIRIYELHTYLLPFIVF